MDYCVGAHAWQHAPPQVVAVAAPASGYTPVEFSNVEQDPTLLKLPHGYHWYETMIVLRPTLMDEERCATAGAQPPAHHSIRPHGSMLALKRRRVWQRACQQHCATAAQDVAPARKCWKGGRWHAAVACGAAACSGAAPHSWRRHGLGSCRSRSSSIMSKP